MPKYWVRMGFVEQCYVERYFLVDAPDAEHAKANALAEVKIIDEGEDHVCSPEGRDDLRLIDDDVSREEKPGEFPDADPDEEDAPLEPETAVRPAPDLLKLLSEAERFISGFEGDESQEEPVAPLLAKIRAALEPSP